MPKLIVIHDGRLGDVAMPGKLRQLLDAYCIQHRRTKSDVVRAALANWLHADVDSIMESIELEQRERLKNNGDKDRTK